MRTSFLLPHQNLYPGTQKEIQQWDQMEVTRCFNWVPIMQHALLIQWNATKLDDYLFTRKRLHKSGPGVLLREERYWGSSFCGCFWRAVSVGVFCKLRFQFKQSLLIHKKAAVHALHFPGKRWGSTNNRSGCLWLSASDNRFNTQIYNWSTKSEHGEEQIPHLLSQSFVYCYGRLSLFLLVCFQEFTLY